MYFCGYFCMVRFRENVLNNNTTLPMNFEDVFAFLHDLQENNHKEWLDANRKRYNAVRDFFIDWLATLNETFLKIDPDYTDTDVRKALNRINNNLMFHPNKPIYKDHLGAGLDMGPVRKQCDFYVQVGISDSFIAGGFYKPQKEILDSIRHAIDYDGEHLKAIIEKPSFMNAFNGLIDDGATLKTAPAGFSRDHEHIDLLRLKTVAVEHRVTPAIILSSDFRDYCVQLYLEMKLFRAYLNKAVTV